MDPQERPGGPKESQRKPTWCKERLQRAQEEPKMAGREAQEAPKGGQREPQRLHFVYIYMERDIHIFF